MKFATDGQGREVARVRPGDAVRWVVGLPRPDRTERTTALRVTDRIGDGQTYVDGSLRVPPSLKGTAANGEIQVAGAGSATAMSVPFTMKNGSASAQVTLRPSDFYGDGKPAAEHVSGWGLARLIGVRSAGLAVWDAKGKPIPGLAGKQTTAGLLDLRTVGYPTHRSGRATFDTSALTVTAAAQTAALQTPDPQLAIGFEGDIPQISYETKAGAERTRLGGKVTARLETDGDPIEVEKAPAAVRVSAPEQPQIRKTAPTVRQRRAHTNGAAWTGTTGKNQNAAMGMPSGMTTNVAIAGDNPEVFNLNARIGDDRGTSSMFAPQVPAATPMLGVRTIVAGCPNDNSSCSRGTMTVIFNRPVRNPTLHLTGMAFRNGTHRVLSEFILTGSAPSGATLARRAGTSSLTVNNGNTITSSRSNPENACDNSTLPNPCGSVQVQGVVSSLTFNLNLKSTGYSPVAFVTDIKSTFTVSADEDQSNAPAAFGAAAHDLSNLTLGPDVTADEATAINTAARINIDDTNDANPAFSPIETGNAGSAYTVSVPVSGVTSTASLAGWIDFNGSKTFESGERATNNAVAPGATSADLTWTLPSGMKPGMQWSRFRLGYDSAQTAQPAGMADSGEVEDYPVPVETSGCGAAVNAENGGFEVPSLGTLNTRQYPADQVPPWRTTDAQNLIELWKNGFSSIPSREGNQFAELNATSDGALYQDVPTVPGDKVYWRVAHRGRLGTDTMAVRAGSNTVHPDSLATVPGGQFSDGNTTWGVRTGAYTVPANQYVTRFAFKAVSSSGGDKSTGNFLDDVFLGSPPCVAATKTVTPTGTVNGADELTYQVKLVDYGGDSARGTVLQDSIPAGTTYKPGSLRVVSGPGAGAKTDAGGDDTADFDAANKRVTFRLGTGATATAGGKLDNTGTLPDGTTIEFKATVDGGSSPVVNKATITYRNELENPAQTLTAQSNEVSNPVTLRDYGDAPNTYRTTRASTGPSHIVSDTLRLGAGTSAEGDARTPLDGTGDTLDDAVTEPVRVPAKSSFSLTAAVQNTTGAAATLTGWVDGNGNGNFESEERAMVSVPDGATSAALSWPAASTWTAGRSYLRLRLYTGTAADPSPGAEAGVGEVEDHRVGIVGEFCDDIMYYSGAVGGGEQLHRVDRVSGARTTIGSATSPNYDGLAYNSIDGKLYSASHGGPNRLVRIDPGTGAQTALTVTGLPASNNTSLGAMSPNGRRYYFMKSGEATLYVVDTDPASATYLTLLPNVTLSAAVSAFDLAMHPVDGNLYAITNDSTTGRMIRIDPAGGTVTQLNQLSAANRSSYFNGLAFDGEGNLFAIGDGVTAQVDLTRIVGGVAQQGKDVRVGSASGMSTGDGAGCLMARDFGDAPDSYKTKLTAGGPRHNLRLNADLRIGADVDAEPEAANPLDGTSDDTTNRTDEDGVTGPVKVPASGPYSQTVTVRNSTGAPATLAGWIDGNRNGTFDTGERATAAVADAATSATLTWPDTSAWSNGASYLRLRLFSFTVANPAPDGEATAGEVEDHPVTIQRVGIRISKSANKSTADPGGTVTYTVTVTNGGETAFDTANPARFSDDLTRVLDDSAYQGDVSADKGTATHDAATKKINWSGALAVGEVAKITYSVRVNNPDEGDHQLINSVTSTTFGATCVAGTETGCTTTVRVPDLRIAKTASPPNAGPGETVSYTVTVRNAGATDFTGVSIEDDLADVLDDAQYVAGSAASDRGNAPQFVPATKKITWSGDLAAGQTATLTYRVTVNTPQTGNKNLRNVITSNLGNCQAGSTDAKCTTSTKPGVVIKKTADKRNAGPGETVTYTVKVTNNGAAAASASFDDDLSDVLDDADFVTGSESADVGTATFDSGGKKVSWSGSVPAGATATVTYQVKAKNPQTGNKNLGNVITSDKGNCVAGSTDPDCKTSTKPGMVIKKSADKPNAGPGETVTFTVTVKNNGPATEPVSFEDNLTDVLDDADYVAGSAGADIGTATFDQAGKKLTWSGSIPAGGTATVTYRFKIKNPQPGNKNLGNAITSDKGNCVAGSADPDCGTSTKPAVTIKKSTDKKNAGPGETVIFTVTVRNNGSAAETVSFDDNLSDVLDDADYVAGSAGADIGTATFSAADKKLSWSGSVPAGGTATVTYRFKIKNPQTGNKNLGNVITSDKGNCVAGSADPDCGTSTKPTVTIKKSADKKNSGPGETVTYTVTVTNNGTAADSVSFEDDLTDVLDDADYVAGSASADVGTATFNAAGKKISWSGSVPAGATATVTYRVTVKNPQTGNKSLGNLVTSNKGNCVSGSTDPECKTETKPAIVVKKTADKRNAGPGDTVTYTVKVANNGTAASQTSFEDDLTDVLDDADYVAGSASADVGSATFNAAGKKVSWSGSVPAGATATVTYQVKVKTPQTGNKSLGNLVVSDKGTCVAGSTDPDCTTETKPAIVIDKRVNKRNAGPGDTLTYSVTVKNNGTAAEAVSFDDDLTGVLDDANFVTGSETADIGTATFKAADQKLSWSGSVPAGATATITYQVRVKNPQTGDKNLKNTVISDKGNCTAGSTDPDCRTETKPEIKIKKTADKRNAGPGDTVTYTVKVTNNGTAAGQTSFEDDLTDVLDDADYVAGSASADVGTATFTAAGKKISWSGSVPAGATATVTYRVTVKNPQTGNKGLGNLVTSDKGNCVSGSGDPDCTTQTRPAIVIKKSTDRQNAGPGETITFTVRVTNNGAAAENATFDDDLKNVLDDADYVSGSAIADHGSVSYQAAEKRINWSGSVPAGTTATITYQFKIKDPQTGDKNLGNAVVSDKGNCVAGSTDPDCGTSTKPAIVIKKTTDKKNAGPGDTLTYTVKVTNNGSAVENVTFDDDLAGVLDDADYVAGSASADVGAAEFKAAEKKLSWSGSVPARATATVTYQVKVKNPQTGDKNLGNAVVSDKGNCVAGSTDPDCKTSTKPAVVIRKTADKKNAGPGETLTYTVKVTNNGDAAETAKFDDDLTNVLDDADYVTGSATADIGTATFDATGKKLSWNGSVPAGATATITYQFKVKNPQTGDKNLGNAVVSDKGNCVAGSTDPECGTSTKPAIVIKKTADKKNAGPGDTVTYTVTVKNNGTAADDVSFEDDLADVLDDADYVTGSASADIGTATFSAADKKVTWSGNVPAGGTAAVTYQVKVKNPQTGNKSLGNAIVSDKGNCVSGSTDPECKTSTKPAVVIKKSTDKKNAGPGDTLTYTVKVTNNGDAAEAVTFDDDLTGVLDDADFVAGSASADVGTATFSAADKKLSWNGSVPAGATATVTYQVKVKDPQTGDKNLRNAVTSDKGNCVTGSTDPDCKTSTKPAIVIKKTTNKPNAGPGDRVTYTVTVTNNGSAAESATFADDLTGVLDDADFVTGSESADVGTATFSAAGKKVTWSGSVPAGATATVTYRVLIKDPQTGDKNLGNLVVSDKGNCQAGSTDPDCGTSTKPAVVIKKSTDKKNAGPGDTVTYTIKVTNNGTAAESVTFDDDLTNVLDDADYVTGTANADVGTATFSAAEKKLSWSGSVPAGATATVTYQVKVKDPQTGDKNLGNAVTSDKGNCVAGSADPDCKTSTKPAVVIRKSTNKRNAGPGDTVTYTVKVTNNGDAAETAKFDDDLTNVLDDADYVTNSATADIGTAEFKAADKKLSWSGTVPAGATATVTYQVKVKNPQAGDKNLGNAVVSDKGNCQAGSTDPECGTSTKPAVVIKKSTDKKNAGPGDTVTYTVKVTNNGTAAESVTFDDDLTNVLDDADFMNGSITADVGTGTFSAANKKLSWNGSVPAGATATVTYQVKVKDPQTGDKNLGNAVTSNKGNCVAGSTDPDCKTTTKPAVVIRKSTDKKNAGPGDTLTYTVKVTNNGTAAESVTFTDDLTGVLDDADFVVGSESADVGTATFSSAGKKLTWSGTVPAGATATVTYRVLIKNPQTGDKNLGNAVVSDKGNCVAGSTDPECGTSTKPAVVIKKSTDKKNAGPGDTLTYTVKVTNNGTAAESVRFDDDLTGVLDDADFVTGSANADVGTVTFSSADKKLTWSGTVPAGATAAVTYQVKVKSPQTGDKNLKNAITSNKGNCVAGFTDPDCRTETKPAVVIRKTADKKNAGPGETLTYTVKVTNNGTAAESVTFDDDLTNVLDDANYVTGTATADIGTATFDATGKKLSWNGSVPAGATATITYQFKVKNPQTGDKNLGNAVVSDKGNCQAGSTDPECGTSTKPAIVIKKSTDKKNAGPGDTVTYTVTVKNNGSAAEQVSFEDDLTDVLDDADYVTGSESADVGTATFNAAGKKLSWSGSVQAGATATVTYRVKVRSPQTGDKSLGNLVTSDKGNCVSGSTDPECGTTTKPDVVIKKSTDKKNAGPGDTLTYTVKVTNSGTAAESVTFDDDLTNVLDDADFVNGSEDADLGSVTFNAAGKKLSWNGSIPAGATATVTYRVKVKDPQTGDKNLGNAVTSNKGNCVTGSTDPDCRTSTKPAIVIRKTTDKKNAGPGDTLTYTVKVTNNGEAAETARFDDDLTNVLDDADYVTGSENADLGTARFDATGKKLSWNGSLAPGATATITYRVKVKTPQTGDKNLGNAVTADKGNCQAGSTDPECKTETKPAIVIKKSTDKANAGPGDTVTYTVKVTNNGDAAETAKFDDDLTDVMDDADHVTGSASADVGTATFAAASKKLSWNGTVPAGATATITYRFTIKNPQTGNKNLANVITSDKGNCVSGSTDPDCKTSTKPTIVIKKTTDKRNAGPGETVTYTVKVTNNGTAAENVSFDDLLAGVLRGADYVEGSATADLGAVAYNAPDRKLTWSGSVPAAQTATITYQVKIKDPQPGDKNLANVVVSDKGNCQPGSTDPECGTSTKPKIVLLKISRPKNAGAGDTVTYTVTVANNGAAAEDVSFDDDLTQVLDDADFVAGSAQADLGTATYTAAAKKLTWSGNVPSGATATITYQVKIKNPQTGDKNLANLVISDKGNCQSGSKDPDCRTATKPEVTFKKTTDKRNAGPGDTVTYTVKVTNNGTAARDSDFDDDLFDVLDDADFVDGSATADVGTAQFDAPSRMISWAGNLPAGGTATITYQVTVKNPMPGNKVLRNLVVSDEGNCATASADPDCRTETKPAVVIKKTTDKRNAGPGDTVTYTVKVANNGAAAEAVSFDDDLKNVLDDAGYVDGSTSADVGTATFSAADKKVTWSGSVPAGATATVTYQVKVKNPQTGDKNLANVVVSDQSGNCKPGSADPDCRTSTKPSIAIKKSADKRNAGPGDTVTFTVTVTNNGETAEPVTFDDDLTNVLDDADYVTNSATADLGTATFDPAGKKLSWNGTVPAGATATITYRVTVKTPQTGDKNLGNVITSDKGNCQAGSTDPECKTETKPAVVIKKTVNRRNAGAGETVTYTVTVANNGTAAETATFDDDLTNVMDDADYVTSSAAADLGTATFSAADKKLSWNGTVPAGAKATITYRFTIKTPQTGDKNLGNLVTSDKGNCVSGSTDPECKTETKPAIVIKKSTDKRNAGPGDTVTYTVTVTNNGDAAESVTTEDDLTGVVDDADYVQGSGTSPSGGVPDYNATTKKLTWTGSVAAGATATITYKFKVKNPQTGDKNLANVIITDKGNCQAGSADPDCKTSTKPAVVIKKTADKKNAGPGETVTYTVTVANNGTAAETATFDDDLTNVLDDADYVDGSATADLGTATFDAAGKKLSWNGTVPAGGKATITYQFTIKAPQTGDKNLGNAVTSDKGNCVAGSTDPECKTETKPAVVIRKIADKRNAGPGDTLTYTVKVTNNGSAAEQVTFDDDLTGVLDDADHVAGSTSADIGTVAFSAADQKLTWSGTVPAGATATITYQVKVKNPQTGDKNLKNAITSDKGNCVSGSTDPECKTETKPAIVVKKTADKRNAGPGDTLTYTVKVTNNGSAAENASFEDDLRNVLDDADYVTGSATADMGTATFDTTAKKITWSGGVPAGATATITYQFKIKAPQTGDKNLGNAVTSDQGNCPPGSTDPDCGTSTKPAVAIKKTTDKRNAGPGDTLTYTVKVTNNGTAAEQVTFDDDLTGVLDDADYVTGSENADVGTATYDAPGKKLSWNGNVPAGVTATVTYKVKVKTPQTGDKNLRNAITSDKGNCVTGSTDPECQTETKPAVVIKKTADKRNAGPGDTVTYTVKVTNNGDAAQTATFDDDLPNVLDDADYVTGSATADLGSATFSSADKEITWSGSVPAGGTATITYQVKVKNPQTGDKNLGNVIISDQGNCTPGSTDPECKTETKPAIVIKKSTDSANAGPDDTLTYTVKVTNNGDAAEQVTFDDDLTGVLDDANYVTGSATADVGTATYDAPGKKITWSGSVPAGDTATITYQVKVKNPQTGDKALRNAVTSDKGNCVTGSTDPDCKTETKPAITLKKTADRKNAGPGDTVTYTVKVTNNGTAAQSASFDDDLTDVLDDADYVAGSATVDVGTATFKVADKKLSWNGTVPAGGTATITYRVTVKTPQTGTKSLGNVLISDKGNCLSGSTDPDCKTETKPAITIKKSTDKRNAGPGDTVSYTVTVKNNGEAAQQVSFDDDLTGVLDDADYVDGSATADVGTATFSAADKKVSWSGSVPAGGTATITYQVKVKNPQTGDKNLKNLVVSDLGNCVRASTDPGCKTETKPGVVIRKTADKKNAGPGDTVTYTVKVTNNGTAAESASFDDDLTGVLDDADYVDGSATADIGTAVYAAADKKVSWSGSVPAGATATITYQVKVKTPQTGDKNLGNAVTSDKGNCPPGSTDPGCGTSTKPAIVIKKATDRRNAGPGDTVLYTVTVRNNGDAAENVSLSDDLTNVLDDADFVPGSATATIGTAQFNAAAKNLTWSGNVPAGTTVTIGYRVTVKNPQTGDKKLGNLITSDKGNCVKGSADPDCKTETRPAITIKKSTDKKNVGPGEVLTFTVRVTNSGSADESVSFADDLADVLDDADFVAGSATADVGSAAYDAAGRKLTWSGTVPAGGTATITYRVTVKNPQTGNKKLGNAVVSDKGNCVGGSTDPDCTTETKPEVVIRKTVDKRSADPGDTLTYTITIDNHGSAANPNLTISDDLSQVLDDGAYQNDAKVTPAGKPSARFDGTAKRLTWTGTVNAGETVTITYRVKLADPPTGDGVSTNTVTSSTGNCQTGSTDPECTTETRPAIEIAKTSDKVTARLGTTVTYTITMKNNSTVRRDGLEIVDDLTEVLDDATYNGDASTDPVSGTLSYQQPQLTWKGELGAGRTLRISYTVKINYPHRGDFQAINTVTSNQGNCRAGSTDPACTRRVIVIRPIADTLLMSKRADRATYAPGDIVTYTITVANKYTATATGVEIDDDLSQVLDDAEYQSGSATGGTLRFQTPKLTWKGDIPANDAVVITYTVKTNTTRTGDQVLTNTIVSDAANCAAGSQDPECTAKVLRGFDIVKSVDRTLANPGDKVTYTVRVANNTDQPVRAVEVVDDLTAVLDDAVYNNDAVASAGAKPVYAKPKLTWKGDVPARTTVTITYSVKINKPDLGDHTLRNGITSNIGPCVKGSTDPACSTTTKLLLAATKKVDKVLIKHGDTATYTVTVTNQSDKLLSGVQAVDDLTKVLDDAKYLNNAKSADKATGKALGKVTYTSPKLTWAGDLQPGQTLVLTYSVKTNSPPTGDRKLENGLTTNYGIGLPVRSWPMA